MLSLSIEGASCAWLVVFSADDSSKTVGMCAVFAYSSSGMEQENVTRVKLGVSLLLSGGLSPLAVLAFTLYPAENP
jgi:hypothetical protein